MGGWKLEVFKGSILIYDMCFSRRISNFGVVLSGTGIGSAVCSHSLHRRTTAGEMGYYMTFPVGLFYYFNQPAFFEDWMMSKRKELFPKQDINLKEYVSKRRAEQLERLKKA